MRGLREGERICGVVDATRVLVHRPRHEELSLLDPETGEVLAERWADGPTRPDAEWEIGADEVIVLSDNRSATIADSRTFGPIPIAAIEHRALLRYWPAGSIGPLR